MLKDIEVIATCDKQGRIKPFRFQTDEDGETVTVQIESSMMYEQQRITRDNILLRYKCKAVANGCRRECELMYHVQSMRWSLTRM